MKRKILLVYAALNHPLRANTQQLIECFRQHTDEHWFYLNLAHKHAPRYLDSVQFDLIIFQTTFMQRLSRSEHYFRRMTARAARLAKSQARKAALVQDEFWNAAKVERFIEEFGVDAVFSVAPPSEWPKIYPNLDRGRIAFHRVLTGYLSDHVIDRLDATGAAAASRPIDICYRAAGDPSPAWGRHGYLRQELADAVRQAAPPLNLKIDISTDARDTKYGDAWHQFLANSRYTIGVESGTSLMDRDGTITARVEAYRAANPEAPFEEVEAHCFPGLDGNAHIVAIGPRHIEACATRTCQILVEGEYNGLLAPHRHYIPLARDFSNLREVLASLGDEDRRRRIVEQAFDDIVRPRKITYGNYAREVVEKSFLIPNQGASRPLTAGEGRILARMKRVEAAEWVLARLLSRRIRQARDGLRILRRKMAARRGADAGVSADANSGASRIS